MIVRRLNPLPLPGLKHGIVQPVAQCLYQIWRTLSTVELKRIVLKSVLQNVSVVSTINTRQMDRTTVEEKTADTCRVYITES